MDGYLKLPGVCWNFQRGPRTWLLLVVITLSGCTTPRPELNANQECLHEDFENRISAAGQCLVLDVYRSPKASSEPLLVAFVHGDGLGNRGYRYIRGFQDRIEDASHRNLIFVALTRPGYQNGRETSTGHHHYHTGDAFRPYIVKSVATAILRLADHYNAKNVAVIGHSGGGIILAGGLGTEPDFRPELAVIIASAPNIPQWVAHRGFGTRWPTERSVSPHRVIANVSPAVEVVAVTGSADKNTLSRFSAEYVEQMKRDGKNARHIDLDGASHNGVLQDDRLWAMLNDEFSKLE